MHRLTRLFPLVAFFLTNLAVAQIPSRTDVTSTPVPNAGHDYIHAPVETVNPANGSLSIRIGVPVPPGRGLTLPFSFAYDSNGEYYLTSPNYNGIVWDTAKTLISQGGWSYSAPTLSLQKTTFYGVDDIGNQVTCYALVNFVMQDASGNRHNLGLTYFSPNTYCNMGQEDGPFTTAQIGSMIAQTTNNWPGVSPVTVTDADGTVYQFPYHSTQPSVGSCFARCQPTAYVATSVTDRNGNSYGYQSAYGGPALVISDGRTLVNIPSFGSNPDTVTVSGFSSPYQVYWTSVHANFNTNFVHVNDGSYTCSTPSGGGQPAVSAISEIALPNGQAFTFSYDPNYGTINKITYPTGGYVRYVWGVNSQSELISGSAEPVGGTYGTCDYYYDTPAILHRYVSFDGVNEVLQQDFSYSTSWGISGNPYDFWNQKQTTVTTHDFVQGTVYSTVYVYEPRGTDEQPNAGGFAPQIPVEQEIRYYADTNVNGTPLRTVDEQWQNERLMTQQKTTLNNTYVSESDWTYDSNEMETDRKDYDYGSGGHGNLLRETVIPSYHSFSNHIVDKPDSVQVKDGGGSIVAGVSYGYDPNGNLLNRSDWLNQTGSSVLTTSHTYDGYGNMITTTDPANNLTQYSYADNFVNTCTNFSNTYAYLTQITDAAGDVQHFAYNCATGELASETDPNGNTTSYQYNDSLDRLTEIDYPSGWGKSTTSYTDTPGSISIESKRIDAGGTTWADAVDLFDGIFHITAHSAANGESTPWNRVDRCYDGNGARDLIRIPISWAVPELRLIAPATATAALTTR